MPTKANRYLLGAAAGLLSAAAGVGASMIVSVVVGGAPTPITAVGGRVIDLTPGAVKDWAIRTLGENDKPFLLGGIFFAIALLACLTGVIAWRSRPVALALTAVLGLVGVVAAYQDPTELVGTVAKIAPALLALVVSVAMLAAFTRGWSTHSSSTLSPDIRTGAEPGQSNGAPTPATPAPVSNAPASDVPSPSTLSTQPDFLQYPTGRPKPGRPVPTGSQNPAPAGFNRRAFLAAALASGAVATVGVGTSRVFGDIGARSREAITLPKAADGVASLSSTAQLDILGLTPYITSNSDFYRVDTALSLPQIDAGSWKLKIHGMVDDEITLSFQDLLDMPLIERRITLACVSNEVGGTYAGNATWLGVRISDLLDQVGYSKDADAIRSTSVDGMTIGTPIAALTDRDAMIAIGMNGQPLPIAHGFPARMVVPGLYGYVSATKWLVDMEVTRFAKEVPDGPGSVAGMAEDKVAEAASNNPLLTQLVAAVSGQINPKVNLVDDLNGGEFTVFAPIDSAFEALDAKTLKALSKPANADMLSSILTYHVVEGQLAPDAVVGEQATLQGGMVEVTGEADMLKVNDANVVCGGVKTANATVYLIDGLLMPAAA